MATAESSLTSLGPRFAPEDPTLPKPWKGLIDGASGALYYWNPETNVTQYERPAGMAPPLPTGPPPSSTTPKLAPVPVASSLTANGTVTSQPCQQVLQQPGQQIGQLQPSQQLLIQQPGQHMPSQHSHKMPYQQIQIQNQQTQPVPQQQGQPYANMQLQQMPYSQVSYVQGQLMPHPLGQAQQGVQNDSLGSQFHHHHGPQSQTSQTMLQQGQQVHAPQIIHQHGQQPHGLQATMQQAQPSQGLPAISQNLQGQQQPETLPVPQQGQQLLGQPLMHQNSQSIGSLRAEEATHQEVKQGEYPSPLVQHSGALLSNQHAPGIGPSFQIPRSVEMFQSHPQFSGLPSLSAQPSSAASVRLQQEEIDTMPHQQQRIGAPTTMNQMGHASFHPPSGVMKVGYEEDKHRRMAHDVYSSGRNESPMMLQQPNLAPSPLARNQPDMRMGASNTHFSAHENSGGLNTLPSRATPSMYNHAPFPNASPIRPPLRMFGSAEYPSISSVDAYRQHHEVTALGDNIPAPFMTFEATGFPPEILKEMHFAGFSSPTPIQAQTWPVALQGRDIVAIAKTGSGKTLGYLMPAYIHLRRCRNSPQGGPTVLVLSPTRELATQIQEEAIKFGRSSRISCICLYGGSSKGPQLREIERGADIVVATPGRLNDFLEMKKINFHQISFLVLDEADRMLDMGFEPQIRKIVDEIPPHRQTLMYTATWPKEVRKIAADLLVNPVQVNIGSVDELVANKSITQYVEVVPPMEKQRRLEQILRAQERGSKIIIFCSTKRLCDQLAQSIGRSFGAAAIHGDKSQDERDRVLGHFRSGRAPILVATDVAARGLDIKDIRVVINYDFPTGIEEYIHRIGRTGRAGAMGVAYTFLTDQDWKFAADLVKVLEGANQFVPPVVREMAERGAPVHLRGRGEMSRWDSGGGGRWDSGAGRGVRDGGGSGFGRRGGGRNEFFGGRGGRGRGFGGPGGRGRHDRGPHDRYNNNLDGRGRYDNRRGIVNRNRDRKYSPSLERVRTSRYDRSRSRSVSRSRSRSWSRSRSRSRSWTPSRSRSCSIERSDRPRRRPSMFDVPLAAPVCEAPASSGLDDVRPADPVNAAPAMPAGFDAGQMSPMSPGQMSPMSPGQDQDTGSFPSRNETADQVLGPSDAAVGANLGQHPVGNM